MKLFNGGAYLVNGTDIVADSPEAGALLQQKTGHTVTKKGNHCIWYFREA